MSRSSFNVDVLGAQQEEVAHRLRAVRESLGLSLRTMASRLTSEEHHVSHVAVMKYERLELKITPDYLERVARVTNVPYGWFLSGVGGEDSPPSHPPLQTAGMDFLPSVHHRWVADRLERLANWCGIPPGKTLEGFYAQVGAILGAPLKGNAAYLRSWTQLTDRELSVYLATQFATLRTVLRRLGDPEEPSGSSGTGPAADSPAGDAGLQPGPEEPFP